MVRNPGIPSEAGGPHLLADPSNMRVVNSVLHDDVEDTVVLVRGGFESSFSKRHVIEQVLSLRARDQLFPSLPVLDSPYVDDCPVIRSGRLWIRCRPRFRWYQLTIGILRSISLSTPLHDGYSVAHTSTHTHPP